MRLYLVQHGEACDKAIDPQRPLTDQGRSDIERLAGFLKRAGVRVDRVVHSGKLRAIQSAELLAAEMAPGVELETSDLINPNDDPGAFDWQSGSWDRDTLVAGHLPFMGKLVSQLLVDDDERPLVAFQPGSMACLQRDGDEAWRLNWMLRPELLR
jgi:phosphohistidine phosphatase